MTTKQGTIAEYILVTILVLAFLGLILFVGGM
jgi:hypothetical protein